MPQGTSISLGERISEAREERGLSSAQAARRTGVTTKTLKNWESGKTRPRPNKLQLLSGVLGVPMLWLIDGHGEFDPIIHGPSKLAQLEQKMERMNELQRQLYLLCNEITGEIAELRKLDEELEELAA